MNTLGLGWLLDWIRFGFLLQRLMLRLWFLLLEGLGFVITSGHGRLSELRMVRMSEYWARVLFCLADEGAFLEYL